MPSTYYTSNRIKKFLDRALELRAELEETNRVEEEITRRRHQRELEEKKASAQAGGGGSDGDVGEGEVREISTKFRIWNFSFTGKIDQHMKDRPPTEGAADLGRCSGRGWFEFLFATGVCFGFFRHLFCFFRCIIS